MTYDPSRQTLLEIARQAALAGNEAILPFLSGGFTVERKADNTPVTDADMAAHHAISAWLRRETPEIPVLSEESSAAELEGSANWERYWCVDPIDGTSEFVAGRPTFTVNVALVEGSRSVLGAVLVPATGARYWGGDAEAWKSAFDEPARQIHTRRAPIETISLLASRTREPASVRRCVERIEADGFIAQMENLGSSLKFCLVAEGSADFFPQFGKTKEWDTAAAQAVVEAAGGGVSNADGTRLAYQKPGLANPAMYTWGDPALQWLDWVAAPI